MTPNRIVINTPQNRKPGDEDIAVAWLNAAHSTPAYRRVKTIYLALAKLRDAHRNYQHEVAKQDARITARREPTGYNFQLEFKRLSAEHQALNKALARYHLTPQVQYWVGTAEWSYPMVSRPTRGDFALPIGEPAHGLTVNEGSAVSFLLKLAENDNLSRVRLCEQCQQKWRTSYRQIDRFCSDSCRLKFNAATPEAKRRHVEAQQKHRRTHGFKAKSTREKSGNQVLKTLGKQKGSK